METRFAHRMLCPFQAAALTMVFGYSRFASAVLVPSRCAEDLYSGWWRLIAELGAVPRVLVWDSESAVGRWRARRTELTAEYQAFRGTLGAKVIICKPGDPEAKGLVERFHDCLERSFLPGRFLTSAAGFNAQLAEFLARANGRVHRMLVLSAGSDRRRPDGDVGSATGAAGHRLAAHAAAAAGLLRGSTATTTRCTRPRSGGGC